MRIGQNEDLSNFTNPLQEIVKQVADEFSRKLNPMIEYEFVTEYNENGAVMKAIPKGLRKLPTASLMDEQDMWD
jgi:hypothetical protein